MSGFESVGQILPRVRRGKSADELLALRVRRAFAESINSIFSSKKLPKITAGKFSFGTLTVLVPDPTWSFELRSKEEQILKRLNSVLDEKLVQKLRFKVVSY